MAKAENSFSEEPRPEEELPLYDMIKLLAGEERHAAFEKAIADLAIAEDEWIRGPQTAVPLDSQRAYQRCVLARDAYFAPFLRLCAGDEMLVTASRGSLSRMPEQINVRAVRRLQVVEDPKQSTLFDPSSGDRLYEVRCRWKPPGFVVDAANTHDRSPQKGGTPTVDPIKTGTPGRPTAAHLVIAEAERRFANGEVVPRKGGLEKFSQDLAAWWEEERLKYEPAGPPMKSGSIKNCIRELWTRALSDAQNRRTKL